MHGSNSNPLLTSPLKRANLRSRKLMDESREHRLYLQRLRNVRCQVDCSPVKRYNHLFTRRKQELMAADRSAEIVRENRLMIERVEFMLNMRSRMKQSLRSRLRNNDSSLTQPHNVTSLPQIHLVRMCPPLIVSPLRAEPS